MLAPRAARFGCALWAVLSAASSLGCKQQNELVDYQRAPSASVPQSKSAGPGGRW